MWFIKTDPASFFRYFWNVAAGKQKNTPFKLTECDQKSFFRNGCAAYEFSLVCRGDLCIVDNDGSGEDGSLSALFLFPHLQKRLFHGKFPKNKLIQLENTDMKDYSKVKALIITGVGLNCEKETAAAFKSAGATPEQIHLNDLLNGRRKLDEFHILAFIGGFAFGDHLGSGTVFANRLKFRLSEDIHAFVKAGKLVIGICNGFQTLTRLGLAPALDGKYFEQQAALTHNDSGVFRDDWVTLRANEKSPCVFTRGIDLIRLPVRHGEGKFVADEDVIARIEKENLVALRYASADGTPAKGFPENPNGSIHDIAGICDPTGRIFGLMPHPEAFLSPFNSPDWQARKLEGTLPEWGEGKVIFDNAVRFAAENLL